MDVRLMGRVELHDGVGVVALARGGERCVLATLALALGRRVEAGTLVDHIWDDRPPESADQTVASYVRAVRRSIVASGGHRSWLRSHRPGGYQLDFAPDLVDYHRFTALVRAAREAARADNRVGAAAAYEQAVALRRGEPLADVAGQWARNRRYAIEQEYLDALCGLYEQQLAIGEFAAVVASATHLIAEVVPTDRMIVLAAHGLAGAGQHAAITGFLDRAARRMWDTAEARPSAEALEVTRRLMTRPDAQLSLPKQTPPRRDDTASADTDAVDAADPARMSTVTMTASHNGRVNQAGGDQYIVEG